MEPAREAALFWEKRASKSVSESPESEFCRISEKTRLKAERGFSPYDDEEYRAAGVEIVGPGKYWNDGYKFQGRDSKSGEASILVEFYLKNGRVASSVEEAMDRFNYLPDESKMH